MTTFRILSPSDQSNVWDAVIALPLDGTHVVEVKKRKETRSQAQSRLRWLWMTQIERQMMGEGVGRNKKQWNAYFKCRLMPEILIAKDPDYGAFFHKVSAMYHGLIEKDDSQQAKIFAESVIGDSIRTEWLNTAGMSEFLNAVDAWAVDRQIRLVVPQDLAHVR